MNEITIYEKIEHPVDAITKLGEMFAKSGMFGCEKAEQGQIMAMQCLSERISPLDLARKYHIINGKLSMRADAMLAEFRNRGGKVEWIETSATVAKAKFNFEGREIELSFTAADATTAGLLPAKPGSGWAKFPDAMLRARLTSKAMRMLCPEAVVGLYTPEEVADFDDKPKTYTRPATRVVQAETVNETARAAEELARGMGDQVGDMCSPGQRKMMIAVLESKGVSGKDAVIKAIDDMIGVQVASTKDLTIDQADRVIELARAMTKPEMQEVTQ